MYFQKFNVMKRTILLAIALLSTVAGRAYATTWYVSPSAGSDATNPGTYALPYKTLLKASDVAQPGDEVIIKNGTYSGFKDSYGSFGSTKGDGTAAARIIIKPEMVGGVILDATGAGCPGWNTPVVMLVEVKYVTLQGFTIKNNACGIGVWVNNCYFTTVKGCTIDNMYAHGILVHGEDVTIDGNQVSNTVKNNANSTSGGGWNQAVGTWAIDNVTPKQYSKRIKYINNTVFNNWGEGLILVMVQDGLMEGNTVYNNFSVQLYVDNSKDVVVRNNHVYVTTDTYNRQCCGRPSGISFAVEPYYPLTQTADNLKIYNNIVSGTGWGLYWFNYNVGSYSNVQIYHNVLHDSKNDHSLSVNSAGTGNNIIKNNIISKSTSIAGTWTLSHNSYPNGIPSGAGTNNIAGNPGFVVAAPSASSKTDFRLSSSSPLRGAGAGVSSVVATDFWGAARSSTAPSIGAHEVLASTLTKTSKAADENQLSIYPSPAADQFTVEFAAAQPGPAKITVLDLTTREKITLSRTVAGGPNRVEVSTAALEGGVYLLQVEAPGKRFTQKITVVH